MADNAQKRPSLVPRHSSNSTTLSSSAQHNKPRAHLVGKKNRSSGQLSKMTRTQSSKSLVKAGTKQHIKFKKSASHVKLNKLGHDQKEGADWEEDENNTPAANIGAEIQYEYEHPGADLAAAASSYLGSFMGVPVTEQQLINKGDDPDEEAPSHGTSLISPHAQALSHHIPKSPKPGHTHTRPLNRNVSFAAQPTVSQTPDSSAESSESSEAEAILHTKKRKSSPPSSTFRRSRVLRSAEASEDEDNHQAEAVFSEPAAISSSRSEVTPDLNETRNAESLMRNAKDYFGQSVGQTKHSTDEKSEPNPEPTEPRQIGQENTSNLRHQEEEHSDSSPDHEEHNPLSEDESSIELKSRANLRNKEFHSSAKEPVSMPAHEIPISRTQFRLNLERQHTLNFREPRQRPSHWPSFDGVNGDRRPRDTDTITSRVSVPRVCREARRELKTIRQRGHDPLCDAVDTVLNSPKWRKRAIKVREIPKTANKKTFWASGKKPALPAKSQLKPAIRHSPAFEPEARVAAVDGFKQHCQRLWNTPVQYGTGDD